MAKQRVLGLMLGKGVERNVVTWTLLMKCYCRRGRADEAKRLLRRMGKRKPIFVLYVVRLEKKMV